MFIRLPILLLMLITTSPSIASFHLLKNDNTLSLISTNEKTINFPSIEDIENIENFSTLLQHRILQILAHQLIDNNQVNKQQNRLTKTHYKTKTFSVSIDTMSTAFYRVSIKDNLQNKETLIKIPR